MTEQKRPSLGLDTADDTDIDIADLAQASSLPAPTKKQQQAIFKAAEETGFVSRQPTRRHRVSPYRAQFGGKCREGMKPLFQEVAERLDMQDTQALEEAIKALIEKYGFDDLLAEYKALTRKT